VDRLVVIGASWGGLAALRRLLSALPADPGAAIAIAQHRSSEPSTMLVSALRRSSLLPVDEAEDKEPIEPGRVYLAPADYHLLVERGHFALSTGERLNYSRPSIDVLFESAADAYGEAVVGIILTGTGKDGAAGLARIKELGGVAIVEDPRTAERCELPEAAVAAVDADVVLPLDEIPAFLAGVALWAPAVEVEA
jgi:two-component system, chemotaxis family, protein-glutamate methylesterase/glutaminase